MDRIIFVLIIYMSSLSFLFCLVRDLLTEVHTYLWIQPFFYGILFIGFNKNRKYIKNLSISLINILIFLRHVILPVSYYLKANDIYINNYIFQINFLMFYEMVAIFATISILAPKILKKRYRIKLNEKNYVGISSLVIIILGSILVVTSNYYKNFFFNFIPKFLNKSEISGFFGLIFNSFLVVLLLWILLIIKKRFRRRESKVKLIISGILCLLFLIKFSIGSKGEISRWPLITNVFVFFLILIRLYPKYIKKLKNTLVILMVFVILISTYYKFLTVDQTIKFDFGIVKSLYDYILDFKILNGYFSGPKNIEISLLMKEKFASEISFITLINDTFMNFPLVNKLLNVGNNSTLYFYNFTIYGSEIARDQIIPLIGQGNAYLSIVFSPLFSVFITIFCMYLNKKIFLAKNYLEYYIYIYACFSFSLFIGKNINILGQTMWINILPLFLILYCDVKLFKSFKKKNKIQYLKKGEK